jgi:hypothetical protein
MTQVWINDALVFIVAVAAIVVGVILMWLFFDLRAYLKRRHYRQDRLLKTLPGIDRHGPMQVRLKDGKTYSGLRLVGVMDVDAARDVGLPHALTNLVAFERDDGSRLWVDAGAIRVIETVGAGAG